MIKNKQTNNTHYVVSDSAQLIVVLYCEILIPSVINLDTGGKKPTVSEHEWQQGALNTISPFQTYLYT